MHMFSAGKAMGFVQLGGIVGKLMMGYVSNVAMRSQVSGPLYVAHRMYVTSSM